MTFTNYFMPDSLCCPSRSSIFTGLVAHNTKAFKNKGKQGGYSQFVRRGLEQETYADSMHGSGYLSTTTSGRTRSSATTSMPSWAPRRRRGCTRSSDRSRAFTAAGRAAVGGRNARR